MIREYHSHAFVILLLRILKECLNFHLGTENWSVVKKYRFKSLHDFLSF